MEDLYLRRGRVGNKINLTQSKIGEWYWCKRRRTSAIETNRKESYGQERWRFSLQGSVAGRHESEIVGGRREECGGNSGGNAPRSTCGGNCENGYDGREWQGDCVSRSSRRLVQSGKLKGDLGRCHPACLYIWCPASRRRPGDIEAPLSFATEQPHPWHFVRRGYFRPSSLDYDGLIFRG